MNKEFIDIQDLIQRKSDLMDRIHQIPFDGYIEIKEVSGSKYIYARSRINGRRKSTYLSSYSDEAYALFQKQAIELRALKKELRSIERQLAEKGYQSEELSPRVLLNIDFARSNVKTLIFDQAVLEGITTTFPQTETILDNGKVNGIKADDIQKILNLKHAWEFILSPDIIQSPTNLYLLSYIGKLVNEGFYTEGGRLRSVPVRIGGTDYVPPIPLEIDVKERIESILSSDEEEILKAIDLALYVMKTQVFNDGNKRSAIIFANQYLISKGQGLLVVPESIVTEFKRLLIQYYENKDRESIRQFMKDKCWRRF